MLVFHSMVPVNAVSSDDSEERVWREPDRWTAFILAGIFYATRRSHLSARSTSVFNFSGSEIGFPLLFTEQLDFDLWPYMLAGKNGLGTIATS